MSVQTSFQDSILLLLKSFILPWKKIIHAIMFNISIQDKKSNTNI